MGRPFSWPSVSVFDLAFRKIGMPNRLAARLNQTLSALPVGSEVVL
jgi:hypothetical protein